MEKIAKIFEIGKTYGEAEVNEKIEAFFEDYCTIRRDMISEGNYEAGWGKLYKKAVRKNREVF